MTDGPTSVDVLISTIGKKNETVFPIGSPPSTDPVN
jgi:hypothetical protein